MGSLPYYSDAGDPRAIAIVDISHLHGDWPGAVACPREVPQVVPFQTRDRADWGCSCNWGTDCAEGNGKAGAFGFDEQRVASGLREVMASASEVTGSELLPITADGEVIELP
jgi:hypothetical protein